MIPRVAAARALTRRFVTNRLVIYAQRVLNPRRRDPERTTADLLSAAEHEFAEHGFAGARVERIAAGAGVNKGLIFQRFGDKLGLYRGVLEGVAGRGEHCREELMPKRLPETREEFRATLTAFVAATIHFLETERAAARILLWEEASGWATLGRPELTGSTPGDADIKRLFDLAADRGWIREGLPPRAQFSLALQAPFTLAALAVDIADPSVRRFMTDFVVDGLMAPGQS